MLPSLSFACVVFTCIQLEQYYVSILCFSSSGQLLLGYPKFTPCQVLYKSPWTRGSILSNVWIANSDTTPPSDQMTYKTMTIVRLHLHRCHSYQGKHLLCSSYYLCTKKSTCTFAINITQHTSPPNYHLQFIMLVILSENKNKLG